MLLFKKKNVLDYYGSLISYVYHIFLVIWCYINLLLSIWYFIIFLYFKLCIYFWKILCYINVFKYLVNAFFILVFLQFFNIENRFCFKLILNKIYFCFIAKFNKFIIYKNMLQYIIINCYFKICYFLLICIKLCVILLLFLVKCYAFYSFRIVFYINLNKIGYIRILNFKIYYFVWKEEILNFFIGIGELYVYYKNTLYSKIIYLWHKFINKKLLFCFKLNYRVMFNYYFFLFNLEICFFTIFFF